MEENMESERQGGRLQGGKLQGDKIGSKPNRSNPELTPERIAFMSYVIGRLHGTISVASLEGEPTVEETIYGLKVVKDTADLKQALAGGRWEWKECRQALRLLVKAGFLEQEAVDRMDEELPTR